MTMARQVRQAFKRKTEVDEFFGEKQYRGKIFKLSPNQKTSPPHLYYEHPNGKLFLGDCVEVMKGLDDDSIDLVFADPPYNIKKADWDYFDSQKEYIDWSENWIKEVARILKPTGSLYVCGFSEIVADIKSPAMKFFDNCRWIIWHYKNKASLANDWGRSHESILHFRKTKNISSMLMVCGYHTPNIL